MKASLRIPLIGVVVLVLGYFAYGLRSELAAKIWHLRHGHFVVIHDYRVPVPDGWLVRSQSERDVTMILTRGETRRPFSGFNFLRVSSPPAGIVHLDAWRSYEEQRLRQRGITDIEEKTLQSEEETVVCVGGTELRDIFHLPPSVTSELPSGVISIVCVSNGRLGALLVGPKTELGQFYTILSQIRKQQL
jgi:hypothetical protein